MRADHLILRLGILRVVAAMRDGGGHDAVVIEQLVDQVRVVARDVLRLLHEVGSDLLHQNFADLIRPLRDVPLG